MHDSAFDNRPERPESVQGGASLNGIQAPPAADGIFGSLKRIAEIAVIVNAIAFIAGWAYLYSYFIRFGLSLMDIEIPFATASVFCLRVLAKSPWSTAAALMLLIALVILKNVHFITAPNAASNALFAGVIVAVGCILGIAGTTSGRQAAAADMNLYTTELPSVAFISSVKSDYPLPGCFTANTLDCRLLTHAKGIYYFFQPVKDRGTLTEAPNIKVYSVPESQVQLMRLQRGLR